MRLYEDYRLSQSPVHHGVERPGAHIAALWRSGRSSCWPPGGSRRWNA